MFMATRLCAVGGLRVVCEQPCRCSKPPYSCISCSTSRYDMICDLLLLRYVAAPGTVDSARVTGAARVFFNAQYMPQFSFSCEMLKAAEGGRSPQLCPVWFVQFLLLPLRGAQTMPFATGHGEVGAGWRAGRWGWLSMPSAPIRPRPARRACSYGRMIGYSDVTYALCFLVFHVCVTEKEKR